MPETDRQVKHRCTAKNGTAVGRQAVRAGGKVSVRVASRLLWQPSTDAAVGQQRQVGGVMRATVSGAADHLG